jgi:RHS repeat-associated protein
LGRNTKINDARGNQITYTYDHLNRLNTATDPDRGMATSIYDDVGNLRFQQDENHDVSVNDWVYFKYDNLHRLIEDGELFDVSDPSDSANSSGYPSTGNSWRTKMFYDLAQSGGLDQPQSGFYGSDPNVVGRLARVLYDKGDVGSTDAIEAYEYDARGRVIHVGKRLLVVGAGGGYQWFETRYGYDSADNLTNLNYPDGFKLVYNYDEFNRLDTLYRIVYYGGSTPIQVPITSYNYYPSGRDSLVSFNNGVTTSYSYHPQGWMTSIHTKKGTTDIHHRLFDYDFVGNLLDEKKVVGGGGAPLTIAQFQYDDLNRLKKEIWTGKTIDYTYDEIGNRLKKVVNVDTTNYSYPSISSRLSQTDDWSYMYDGNGNMFSASHPDESRSLSYDYANRLTRLIITPTILNGGPDTLMFNYDHTLNRIEKREHGVSTFYLYEGVSVSTEINANGTTIAKYVYAGEHVVKIDSAGAIYYYHNDLVGSVRRISDSLGVVVWQGDYFAFGEIDTTQSSPGFENTHKFTGKQFDNPANYYYYNARYYDPDIGRFFSSDPIPTGNPYSYAVNNPLKFTDPTGMFGMPPERFSILPPEGPLGFGRGQFSGAMPTSYFRMLYYTGQVYPWIDVRDPNYWTAQLIAEHIGLSGSKYELLALIRLRYTAGSGAPKHLKGNVRITAVDIKNAEAWLRENFEILDYLLGNRLINYDIMKGDAYKNDLAKVNAWGGIYLHIFIYHELANKDWALRELIAHELLHTYLKYLWNEWFDPDKPSHYWAEKWVNFYIGWRWR